MRIWQTRGGPEPFCFLMQWLAAGRWEGASGVGDATAGRFRITSDLYITWNTTCKSQWQCVRGRHYRSSTQFGVIKNQDRLMWSTAPAVSFVVVSRAVDYRAITRAIGSHGNRRFYHKHCPQAKSSPSQAWLVSTNVKRHQNGTPLSHTPWTRAWNATYIIADCGWAAQNKSPKKLLSSFLFLRCSILYWRQCSQHE